MHKSPPLFFPDSDPSEAEFVIGLEVLEDDSSAEDFSFSPPDLELYQALENYELEYPKASFTILPPHIQEQIFHLLDNKSLLALGKVCHLFNRTALEVLFSRYRIGDVAEGRVVANLAPPEEIILGLCAALWFSNLTSIAYNLNPNINFLFNEIQGLTALVSRMSALGLGELHLSFNRFDAFARDGTLAVRKTIIKGVAWRDAFERLLFTALAKGCWLIKITGAHALSEYLDTPIRVFTSFSRRKIGYSPDRRHRTGSKVRAHRRTPLVFANNHILFIRDDLENVDNLMQMKPCRSPPAPSPRSPSLPSLESLFICSSMLLQPLFFATTFRILGEYARGLRFIHLIGIKTTERLWRVLLTNVYFPVLEYFSFVHDTSPVVRDPVVTPGILANFLSRHTTISVLKLRGVNIFSQAPKIQLPLLPKLKILEAHPVLVIWIISSEDDDYPHLESVCITSEHYEVACTRGKSDYNKFHQAIYEVWWLRRPVRLTFRWTTEHGLWEWMEAQIDRCNSPSFIRGLDKISDFVLCVDHISFTPKRLQLLVKFLALFPRLKRLEIVKDLEPEQIQAESFYSSVLETLPTLYSFVVCGKSIF